MSKNKIIGGTGITAGGDVHISDVSGQITIGENIKLIHKEEKKQEKLEGYLQEHSKKLIEGPIKNWSKMRGGNSRSAEYKEETIGPIHATYRPHTKSEIIDKEEGSQYAEFIPEYANLVIEHLKSGYTDNVDTWLYCKNIIKSYLEKKFNTFERIEEKILSSIPKGFTKDKNEHTRAKYLLPHTIAEIYKSIENFIIKGEQSRFEIKHESDIFKIYFGNSRIAELHEENMVEKFKELINVILISKDLIEEIKLCIAEKNHMVEKINQFYQEFDRIIDDFENGHCLLYTSPSPRDVEESRMPSSA